ncbi:hypothetical protein J5Y03_16015 [Bacillus sp. RG28]|uniref:Uncharacterized protein n=1 Tax=Gottfriedia endophytica TaxID=2820819 RepID=A0A940SK36_9BACI|nr:hypothetical protein [Gottfriedia endophytica]MBP0726665.1 hypothetical protein [Gottfriedia endophytica]
MLNWNNLKHPFFGHTLTTNPLSEQNHPLSLHGPVVHLTAVIKLVEQDVTDQQGTSHMHFLINHVEVISVTGGDASMVSTEIFCAVRYGDSMGLSDRIDRLEEGQPIEMQGEYIDVNHAYPSVGNPGDAVLHFTHHPIGFVIYQGKRYE